MRRRTSSCRPIRCLVLSRHRQEIKSELSKRPVITMLDSAFQSTIRSPAPRCRIASAALVVLGLLAPNTWADEAEARPETAAAKKADDSEKPQLPSIFISGDSTAQPGNPNAVGWGKPLVALFDPAKVNVVNRAIGGRSSRTFVAEGRWERLLAELKPKDFVLIQFGHNDGGPVDRPPRRGSLPGLGDETQEVDNPAGQKETIHTYGWYMRK